MSFLHPLDVQLATLKSKHPGWRIWFVPTLANGTRWCATRLPALDTDSAEHLSEEIETVEREAAEKIRAET
jgi:hypothetical protein